MEHCVLLFTERATNGTVCLIVYKDNNQWDIVSYLHREQMMDRYVLLFAERTND